MNRVASLEIPDSMGESPLQEIREYCHREMVCHQMPGLALAVVRDGEVLLAEGQGYASLAAEEDKVQVPVAANTLFELASLTKAFTALGILRLEAQGRLRLGDPVRRYLPWFSMHYGGERVEITLLHLLHHTSGIPFASLALIPEAEDEGALRRTVESLVGQELQHLPGEEFLYATIGYDVLGLILEEICQRPFEEALEQEVIKPLGLHSTRVGHRNLPTDGVAQGHKLAFLRPVAYGPPPYRGNVPAAYVLSTAADLARWLQVQLGQVQVANFPRQLIERAWQPEASEPVEERERLYGMGWELDPQTGRLSHAGSNPTFSAYQLLDPATGLGIVLVSNLGGAPAEAMVENLLAILRGEAPSPTAKTLERKLDRVSSTVTLGAWLASAVLAMQIISRIFAMRAAPPTEAVAALAPASPITTVVIALMVMGFLAYGAHRIPKMFLGGLNWRVVRVWAPNSFPVAILSALFLVALITLHILLGLLVPLEYHANTR